MEELLLRSIRDGKRYEDISQRLRDAIPYRAWQERVRTWYIQQGLPWAGTLATAACTEADYYDHLVRTYKAKQRLFPYHMAQYICGVMRITPFKYYFDMLYQAMKNEQQYDQIPNFTAAEIVRLLGVERNDYIAKLNSCSEKKLLWRINKSIAKEQLPADPVPPKLQGWWRVHAVHISEKEYRELSSQEEQLLRQSASGTDGVEVSEWDEDLIVGLYRKHLIYIAVPVSPHQRFSTSSLEGFVSNRNMVAGEADPMEALLYEVFVTNSERLPVEALARVLDKPVLGIQHAMSIACRLGFAVLVDAPDESPFHMNPSTSEGMMGSAGGSAIAIVLDAEATSYLMMGSLSPGMKKHSVTLFEGGRLAGEATIADIRVELQNSLKAGESFEGEMVQIVRVLESLSSVINTLCDTAEGHPVEVIRKESLGSLGRGAAERMLQLAYAAVVAVQPLPPPALPILVSSGSGPALFGASGVMLTPWLTLALFHEMRQGAVSLAFMHGQHVSALPPQAHDCTHALLWTWEPSKWPGKDLGPQAIPHLVKSRFLLFMLNGLLATSAVLVQPLWQDRQVASIQGTGKVADENADAGTPPVVLLPLPLSPELFKEQAAFGDSVLCTGMLHSTQQQVDIRVSESLVSALTAMGLSRVVGYLWMLPQDVCGLRVASMQAKRTLHVPYHVSFGVPMYNSVLCKLICENIREASVFSSEGIRQQLQNQQLLIQKLAGFVSKYGWRQDDQGARKMHMTIGAGTLESEAMVLPQRRLVFDGQDFSCVDDWTGVPRALA